MTLDALLRRGSIAYLVIWVISPPLAYGAAWRVLAALAMLLWLVLEMRSSRSVILRPSLPILGAVLIAIYTALIESLVPDAADINRQFQLWIMYFFLLVGESFRRGREGDARFCFWLVLCLLPIWELTTLWGIETISGDVARTVVRSSVEARELSERGVGGYGLVYAVVLGLPFIATMALRKGALSQVSGVPWKRRTARALVWVNFILAVLLVLNAGYSIAVILAAFALISLVLVRSRRTLPMLISICLSSLLALVALVSISPMLRGLEGVAEGTEYAAKLADIRTSLEEGDSTGTVEGRAERYARSMSLFLENPILGTLTFDDVGKHSAILDRFAQYGFVVGLVFLLLLLYVPIAMVRAPAISLGMALAFLVVAAGLPLLNNVFMTWGLMLYMFSRGALAVLGHPVPVSGRTVRSTEAPAHA